MGRPYIPAGYNYTFTVEDCAIRNNHSTGWAGGIWCNSDNLHLNGGTVQGNTADIGAA